MEIKRNSLLNQTAGLKPSAQAPPPYQIKESEQAGDAPQVGNFLDVFLHLLLPVQEEKTLQQATTT